MQLKTENNQWQRISGTPGMTIIGNYSDLKSE